MREHARKDSETAMANESQTTEPVADGAARRRDLPQLIRDSWQVPAVVAAMVAIAGAAWYARTHRAPNRWDEALGRGQLAASGALRWSAGKAVLKGIAAAWSGQAVVMRRGHGSLGYVSVEMETHANFSG